MHTQLQSSDGSDGNVTISTSRLVLWHADERSLQSSVQGADFFSQQTGCRVSPDWPPDHWDRQAVTWLLGCLAQFPDEAMWRPWWIALKDGTIIGTLGTKGPPDAAGVVEIGYSIVSSQWRNGYASEAVSACIQWLLADPRVKQICAHTLHQDPASSGVLRNNGFVFAGTFEDPSDGRIDRFEFQKK